MKMTVNRMILPLLVACLGLSACSSNSEKGLTNETLNLVIEAAKAKKAGKTAPAASGFTLTRAQVASLGIPIDLVEIESRSATAGTFQIATNGDVETWASQDKISLSFRNRVVVATRGLGEDLMSAGVPTLAQLQSAGSSYQRSHTILDGEDKPVQQTYDCHVGKPVAERITVLERSYATRHITEVCSGPSGSFDNDYWLQSDGKIRKSRQFVSNSVGYVVIEHLQ
jgi:hypothetical protein